VQKLSGDAAVALRQTTIFKPATRLRDPQTNAATCHFNFAKQGNQGSRKKPRRSLHAGKVPNGVRWKNLLRR